MKFAFIAAEKAHYPVAMLCRVLGVSRSGYDAARRRPSSARAWRDRELGAVVAAIHQESRRTYGSTRVHRLLQKRGEHVGRRRVARLLRERGLAARKTRRFGRTTDSRHDLPIAPNVLRRAFVGAGRDRVWVGDITSVPTREGWLYRAVLLDTFSRCVGGWCAGADLSRGRALGALKRALRGRTAGPSLVHHRDRGSQYASHE